MNRIPLRSLNDKKLKINVKNPRCLKLFLGTCKNKATKKTYQIHLDAFLKHVGKDYESLLMLSDSELKETLEDYVFFCSSNDRYAVSSIRGKFAAIEKIVSKRKYHGDRIVFRNSEEFMKAGMEILEKYNATDSEKTWFLGLV